MAFLRPLFALFMTVLDFVLVTRLRSIFMIRFPISMMKKILTDNQTRFERGIYCQRLLSLRWSAPSVVLALCSLYCETETFSKQDFLTEIQPYAI